MMSHSNQGPFHPGGLGPLLQPVVASWFCGTPQICDGLLKLLLKLCSVSAADVMLVQPRVEFILSFIHHIAEDEDHSDGVVANAAGLIG